MRERGFGAILPLTNAVRRPARAPDFFRPWPVSDRATRVLFLCLALLLLLACGTTPTPPPPPPTATPDAPAEALRLADTFLAEWCAGRAATLYPLLAASAQATTDAATFAQWYADFAAAATLERCAIQPHSTRASATSVEIGYQAQLETRDFGPIVLENSLRLTLENGRWGVAWTPSAIAVGLAPGGRVARFTTSAPRGRIFDAQGRVLAENEPLLIVGAVPRALADPDAFAAQLGALTQTPPETIAQALTASQPDWFTPLLTLPAEEGAALRPQLEALPGARLRESSRRRYPRGASLAHSVGYVGEITAAQLAQPQYADYAPGAVIGQTGVEAWAEAYLTGEAAVQLVALAPDGSLSRVIAQRQRPGSRDVTLTVDLAFQQAVEAILGERPGAIVALEPQTGLIRALASYPTYDPEQLLDDATYRSALFADATAPLLNRATQAALPPGSVFKIVTMAAGIQSGLYTVDTPYTCTGVWTGLGPDVVMHDWLRTGHGTLTLYQGLVQSCNPVFWNISLALNGHDPTYLPNIARQFGFGQVTGLRGGADAAGLIPDPAWKTVALGESWWAGDAVNMATGQGDVLATPLQVANLMAAVANDGAIYHPTLVAQISGAAEEETLTPEVLAQMTLMPGILPDIHAGLVEVTRGATGTARRVFGDFPISVAGKTGTAENPGGAPHAWFAAYAPADSPQLVVVVMLENGGEGSTQAAPLAREVFAAYFGVKP